MFFTSKKPSLLFLMLLIANCTLTTLCNGTASSKSAPKITKINGLVGNFSFKIGLLIKNLQDAKLNLENTSSPKSTKNVFNRLFLYGQKGCGKTTLARVIAEQSNAKFIDRSAVTIIKTDFGNEVNEIQELFRTTKEHIAKHKQPVVLFIDEAHLLVKTADGKTRLGAQALWLELDKIKNDPEIVVILASNALDGVSKPLLDRFPFVVEIINLDEQLRQDLLEILWFKNSSKIATDTSLMKKLAVASKGISIRGIENTIEKSFTESFGQGLTQPNEQMLFGNLDATKAEELGTFMGSIKSGIKATGSFLMGVLSFGAQVASIITAGILIAGKC